MNSISSNLTGCISSEAPQFSVVIPLYNKAHTIVHTLSTVMLQNYAVYEVVIVDDGSTDNGVQLIREHFKDPRIRIIHQENAGVSAARNRGIDEARGEWVAFLDGDDEWLPGYLNEISILISEFPHLQMVGTGGYHKNFSTGKVMPMLMNKYKGQRIELNYYINPDMMPHIGATVIKKSLLLKIGGFPKGIRVSEDVCLKLKAGLHTNIGYSGRPLHVYVGDVIGQTTSAMRNQVVQNRKDEAFVFSDVFDRWEQSGRRNDLVGVFLRYKLYHSFYCGLKSNDYVSITTLANELSDGLKNLLGTCFLSIAKNQKLNWLAKLYILYTKIVWRAHRFPRVGEFIEDADEMNKLYYSTMRGL